MIEILDYTTKEPLQMIGKMAGVCWNANVNDKDKNIKRALDCITSGHGRVEEFPDIYLIIDGYSAKMMRELYTHIAGVTRLQASTRYIDYTKNLECVTPKSIKLNDKATTVWNNAIKNIHDAMMELKGLGVPTEDYTNLLPLAYKSKMVWKINLRSLENFMNQRMCVRAYWEIREFAYTLKKALSDYSSEWGMIADKIFSPKCEKIGFCTEKTTCGRKQKRGSL